MSWRDAGRGILKGITGRLGQRPEPVPEAPAAPAPPPKPAKLTVEERIAAFDADMWSLGEKQVESLIEAWDAIDPAARDAALDQARPSLTAADRKDLFTSVREELRRWQAGEPQHQGGPASSIPSTNRLRASRVLLDAAMATVAQDRLAKRHFEVLYAPLRTAITGDPMHLPQTALLKAGKAHTGVEDETTAGIGEHDGPAEPATAEPTTERAVGARPATRRSHARHAPAPEQVEGVEDAPQAGSDAAPAAASHPARRRSTHNGQS